MVFLFFTLVPILYSIYNSQHLLKKYDVKGISRKRRERLDREHGVDRESFMKNMEKLDEAYRVTEKEEIKKMRQLGKSPKDYLNKKYGDQLEEEDIDQIIKQQFMSDQEGNKINVQEGKDFKRVEFSSKLEDAPDPRVHGAKVIFDSRLDKFSQSQEK